MCSHHVLTFMEKKDSLFSQESSNHRLSCICVTCIFSSILPHWVNEECRMNWCYDSPPGEEYQRFIDNTLQNSCQHNSISPGGICCAEWHILAFSCPIFCNKLSVIHFEYIFRIISLDPQRPHLAPVWTYWIWPKALCLLFEDIFQPPSWRPSSNLQHEGAPCFSDMAFRSCTYIYSLLNTYRIVSISSSQCDHHKKFEWC
jgi:hypothetical protein